MRRISNRAMNLPYVSRVCSCAFVKLMTVSHYFHKLGDSVELHVPGGGRVYSPTLECIYKRL